MMKLKNFLATNATVIYFVAAALVWGFMTGWYVAGKFHKAEQVDQLQTKIEKDTKSIEASNQAEQGIVNKNAEIETQYIVKTKEIVKYVPETVYNRCITDDGTVVDTVLYSNAVSVLNDYASTGIQSTSVGNAEIKTPTEIGLRELSEYIITIKKQYQELAAQHDGLVDYNLYYKQLINQ